MREAIRTTVAGLRGPGLTPEDRNFLEFQANRASTASTAILQVEQVVTPLAGQDTVTVAEAAGSPVFPALFQNRTYKDGSTYIVEVLAKAGASPVLSIFAPGNIGCNSTFDLTTGAVTGGDTEIIALGDGWYGCRVTKTAATDHTSTLQLGAWRSSVFPPGGYVGQPGRGLYVYQVREWKDGVLVLDASAADLASAAWVRQNVTAVIDKAIRYQSAAARISEVERKVYAQPLKNKPWAALGSSITEQLTYIEPLAKMSGMILFNGGRSGGSLGKSYPGRPNGPHEGQLAIFNKIATIPVDSTLVTLECGPNDFAAAQVPLGVLGDMTTDTFHGALYAAVVAIRARAPNARIVFLTPYGSGPHPSQMGSGGTGPTLIEYSTRYTNVLGNTLAQFQQAIIDVGAYLGIPVIDVGRKGGIGWFNANVLTRDGLHINAPGGLQYARYVFQRLLEIAASGYFD